MADRIEIRDLRVRTRIGVSDSERAQPRDVVVHLGLEVAVDAAAETDDLSATVDYSRVISLVSTVAGDGERRLLESLAGEIAARITAMEGVLSVTVEVVKERPPVVQDVGAVAVRIERRAT